MQLMTGVVTSFHYRDPDANNVALTAQNIPTYETMTAFMQSDGFKANPSGIELEAETFVARFKSGVDITELLRLD